MLIPLNETGVATKIVPWDASHTESIYHSSGGGRRMLDRYRDHADDTDVKMATTASTGK